MNAPQGKLLKQIENQDPKLFKELIKQLFENHEVFFKFDGKRYKITKF